MHRLTLEQFRTTHEAGGILSVALGLLRELGIREANVDARQWQPEQADLGRATRPDRARQMQAAHEAAELKRLLEELIREADDPATVWHDAETLFAELEALYAG